MHTAVALICLLATACSFAPRPDRMRPDPVPGDLPDARIAVGDVTGGRSSSFWTGPHLDARTFAVALATALRNAGLSGAACRYRIDAHIEDEDFSGGVIASPDSGVGLTVRYVVTERANGVPVWQETMRSGSWIRQHEVFVGVERARRAIEIAAERNLHQMLSRLIPVLAQRAGDAPAGTTASRR